MTKETQDVVNALKMLLAALVTVAVCTLLGLGCSVDSTSFGGGALGGHGTLIRGDASVAATGGTLGVGGAAGSGEVGSGGAPIAASGGVVGSGGASDIGGAAGVLGSGGAVGTAGSYTPSMTCYAGKRWSGQNDAYMRPGSTCNTCHAFTVAGTVFTNLQEDTNCFGVDGTATSVSVLLVDATGAALALKTNEAGNFWTNAALTFPVTAITTYGSGRRVMLGKVSSGDCNSCHGTAGYSTRIVPP